MNLARLGKYDNMSVGLLCWLTDATSDVQKPSGITCRHLVDLTFQLNYLRHEFNRFHTLDSSLKPWSQLLCNLLGRLIALFCNTSKASVYSSIHMQIERQFERRHFTSSLYFTFKHTQGFSVGLTLESCLCMAAKIMTHFHMLHRLYGESSPYTFELKWLICT